MSHCLKKYYIILETLILNLNELHRSCEMFAERL